MGMNVTKEKLMKKIMMLVLTICLIVPCFSMITYAANGKIMFTDPSTKVGEVVEVRGVLQSNQGIEDRKIEMSYDTSMLRFKTGDNVKETEPGKIVYEVMGSAESDGRAEFLMSFDVLKQGTTKITVDKYQAWTTSDEVLNCDKGSSTIAIAEGEVPVDEPAEEPENPNDTPVQGEQVEVNGIIYTFSNNIPQAEIPEGFAQTTIEYAGKDCSVVFGDSYNMYLGYLVDAENSGTFFLYSQEDATFEPYVELSISDTTKIMMLSKTEGIILPEPYAATTMFVNGTEFPAWVNTEKTELCILYAVNSHGEKSLYQLDTSEGTYQKFEAPADTSEDKENDSFIEKLSESLTDHLDIVILGTGIGFIVFLLIVVVLSVKLYNRNAELDEIYEEYGIDFEEDEIEEPVAKKTKKNRKEIEVDDDDIQIVKIESEQTFDKKEAADEKFTEEDSVSEVLKEQEFKQEELKKESEESKENEAMIDLSGILEEVPYKSEFKNRFLKGKEGSKESEMLENDFYDDEDDDFGYEIDFIDLDD